MTNGPVSSSCSHLASTSWSVVDGAATSTLSGRRNPTRDMGSVLALVIMPSRLDGKEKT